LPLLDLESVQGVISESDMKNYMQLALKLVGNLKEHKLIKCLIAVCVYYVVKENAEAVLVIKILCSGLLM